MQMLSEDKLHTTVCSTISSGCVLFVAEGIDLNRRARRQWTSTKSSLPVRIETVDIGTYRSGTDLSLAPCLDATLQLLVQSPDARFIDRSGSPWRSAIPDVPLP